MIPGRTRLTPLILIACAGFATPGAAQNFWSTVTGSSAEADSDERSRDILSCPFDELLAAYTSIYTDVQRINSEALFNEVTMICTMRQTRLKLVLDNEEAFRSKLADMQASTQAAVIGSDIAGQCPALPEPSSPQAATKPELQEEPNLAELKAAKAEEIARDVLDCAAPYQVAAILGSPVLGPGLSAILIEDATGKQLTVKVGDVLPGGIRIDEVTREGVMVEAGGERERLPKRPSLPEIYDGGGVIAIPATVQDLFGSPKVQELPE
ncbi:hypothetical protein [uncultured Ruegeria sp.]|uniref:hypothetical protein n=1 Tax=uncultured Ruegeria sp. TaxID=259304 RepID=UPI0026124F92|nr:hypothetical protein [uncultured Ruegeria sp.]